MRSRIERAGVPQSSGAGGRAAGRAGRRRARRSVSTSGSSTCDPERPHDAERRLGVAGAAEAARRASRRRRARRSAPPGGRSTCRPARAMRAGDRGAAGSILIELTSHRPPAPRRRRSPGPRAAPPRAAPRPRRATSSVSVPPRSGEMWCSSKSSMLIRSAPSAWVIPARTPGPVGDVDADPVELAGVAGRRSRACRRRLRAASAIQRARKPASLALERRLELLDPAAVLGERVARARRGCRGRCRPRCAGSRRRSRVMSRSEPPAAASGSWPSTRVGARLVHEHVRERVRQVARERDEPVVRVRVDRDGPRAELGDEAVHEPVALGVGRGGRRQEPGRALEQLGAGVLGAARLRAADRVAADEARRSAPRPRRPRLRRADVGDGRTSRGARAPARELRGNRATGAATTASSASARAASSELARLDRAPLERGRERRPDRGRSR